MDKLFAKASRGNIRPGNHSPSEKAQLELREVQREVEDLRTRHGSLSLEVQAQREHVYLTLRHVRAQREVLQHMLEEHQSAPLSYYLVDNPLMEKAAPGSSDSAFVGEIAGRTITILDEAAASIAETYERLEVIADCTALDVLAPRFQDSQTVLGDCAVMRASLDTAQSEATRAKQESKRLAAALRKVQVQWSAAALSSGIRPAPQGTLPSLLPTQALNWAPTTQIQTSAKLNIVHLAEISEELKPRPPMRVTPGSKIKRMYGKKRGTPRREEEEVVEGGGDGGGRGGGVVQGIRLYLSAFCADVALLLHRFREVCGRDHSEACRLLSAPPFFTRDKVSHNMLVSAHFKNPFQEEMTMIADVYNAVLGSLLFALKK